MKTRGKLGKIGENGEPRGKLENSGKVGETRGEFSFIYFFSAELRFLRDVAFYFELES